MTLTPLLKRLTDVAIILAVSAAIAFIIIASGNSLAAKADNTITALRAISSHSALWFHRAMLHAMRKLLARAL